MRNKIKPQLMLLGLVAIALTCSLSLSTYAQETPVQKRLAEKAAEERKRIEENGDPIAVFNLPDPPSQTERAIRQIRNKEFDAPMDQAETLDQEGDLAIFFSSFHRKEPAFPNRSDVVAIGTITSASAFVSEDKSAVYGEFNFKINRVLKNTVNSEKQQEITINRYGGKVLLPSGKILHRVVDGLYLPKSGGTYLMFLKYNGEAKTYRIITGYKFKEGKIEALDGVSYYSSSGFTERFRNYPKFNGMNTSDFIELVVSDIIQNRTN